MDRRARGLVVAATTCVAAFLGWWVASSLGYDTETTMAGLGFAAGGGVAAFIAGVLATRRPTRDDAGEPAEFAEPGAPDITAIYRIASDISPFFELTAHPADLRGRDEFRRGVSLLKAASFSATDLAYYFSGDNAVISCLAAEALRERPDGEAAKQRILAALANVGQWPFYHGLRFLAEVTPSHEPIIGRTLARAGYSMTIPYGRNSLQEFVRTRLEAGEQPSFGAVPDDLQADTLEQIQGFIATLDHDHAEALGAELERWKNERVDRGFLTSVGEVWTARHRAEARGDIAHDALRRIVDQLEEIYTARHPRSGLLVGPSGVGKTAIVHALAARLHDRGWTIFEASYAELVAGHEYIGQFEESLRKLIAQLRGNRRIVWLIPAFHSLALAGRHKYSAVGAMDMLLPYFERGEVLVLGETQPAAYERLVQTHPRIAAVLSVRRIAELSEAAAKELAREWLGRRTSPDGDHGQVAREAWDLADQFLGETAAPGNVLKLLERTRDRLAAGDPDTLPHVVPDDLVVTLSHLTGLPRSIIDQAEELDLDALRRRFNERILGQGEAVDCLVERIAMIKAGVTDPTRPSGVFLFAGPTGTGKTEIAKTLAEWLFGSARRVIRIDMSELQTPDNMSRILGRDDTQEAGPEIGAALVNQIRLQPFSVILLDEFEKAAPQVWDVFLQLFDDGRLTDRQGLTADFRNTIIILTSNLGGAIPTGAPLGIAAKHEGFDPEAVMRTIERTFRRELVNRIDRIVVFRPLGREILRGILEKELTDTLGRRGLRSRSWALEWDEAAIDFLLEKGVTPDLGARPLKRAIERYFLSPLAVTMVNHQAPEGEQFLFVTRKGERLEVEFVDLDAPRDMPGSDAPAADPRDGPQDGTGSLKTIALGPRGAPSELEFPRARHDRLAGLLDGEAWRTDKAAALSIMEEPGFWEAAERFEILDQIEYQDRIESAFRAAGSLLRRLDREGRSARERYPRNLVGLLGHNLYLIETAHADVEQGKAHDAYLLVETGRVVGSDAAASTAFAVELGRMYRGWAKKRRMRCRVLEETRDGADAGYRLLLTIGGLGAHSILEGESGLHVMETPGERTGRHDRSLVNVRVAPQGRAPAEGLAALLEQAAAALDGGADGERTIVRRYRNEPSPLVRDNVRGWRTGRIDQVLGGDFDLIEPH